MGSENISSLRPFFDGSDYPHWKFKIELYLDCDSIKLWVICKGWELPKTTINGIETIIERDEWSAIQQEGNHKNKRIMITIVSSMTRDERVKLQHCSSANEIWQTLENHYEGNI